MIIKQYKKENYSVLFNQATGLLVRVQKKGFPEPKFSLHGPELLDIAISNWCDKGCKFCYRNSDIDGCNISVEDYKELLIQAQECDVFQIALGGGNPNQHPKFEEILRLTREANIVPSYTTNGRGLTSSVLEASKKYCGAVAVSYYEGREFFDAIELLHSHDIKVNIHFLLTSKSVDLAIDWLKNDPKFLDKINAIVFLNYKNVGKYSDNSLLLNKSKNLKEFFSLISNKKFNFKFGFDSCTISYLLRYMEDLDSKYIESCEAGRFSAFIDENSNLYPCSFMVDKISGISLKKNRLKEVWMNSNVITNMRVDKLEKYCQSCKNVEICKGGCNIFKEINSDCN